MLEIGATVVQLAHMIISTSAPRVKCGVMLVALTLTGVGDTNVRRLACEVDTRQGTQPDQDLYCFTLLPIPDLLDAGTGGRAVAVRGWGRRQGCV